MNKRLALVGGALLALGASAGDAAAQQAEATKPVTGTIFAAPKELEEQLKKFHQAVASRLGVSVERLEQALTEARKEAGLPEGAPLGPAPAVGTFNLESDPLAAAAKTLNLSLEQLREELKTKTLAEVAKARGIDSTNLATAMKNEQRSRIDEAVGKGNLPREVADGLKANLDEHIGHLLNARFSQPNGDVFVYGPVSVAAIPAGR